MTVAGVASRFQRHEQRVAAAAAIAAARRWSLVDVDAIVESWSSMLGETTGIVAGAQYQAAVRGSSYPGQVLAAQGVTYRPAGQVEPGAFAGVASDGRPLASLLTVPATSTLERVAAGAGVQDAMAVGRQQLLALAATQVLDAGRVSSSVGGVADRQVTGYIRQINPGACARCVVLAGRWYGWNAGFLRHPNCACVHVPHVGTSRAEREGLTTMDPQAHFDSLSEAEQARVFTAAGARAIRDGADIGQVVNARRGMRATTAYGRKVRTTTVGTGRRTTAFNRALRADGGPQASVRLMPEQIYRDASSREDAIRLLGRFGYLA